jgi:hypothetical protein
MIFIFLYITLLGYVAFTQSPIGQQQCPFRGVLFLPFIGLFKCDITIKMRKLEIRKYKNKYDMLFGIGIKNKFLTNKVIL